MWYTRSFLVLFAGLLNHLDGVYGQISTNATCATSFNWMNNSKGQSPCLVAAELQGQCSAGIWTVPALPHLPNGQRQAYNPPDASSRNICTCSWAVYNLMSACAACQDGGWVIWPLWTQNCITPDNLVSSQAFPANIPVPGDTVIPAYAAKDPQTWTGATFNATEARQAGAGDATISTSSTSAFSTGPTQSTSQTSTATSSGGGDPPIGPIVGGVVGGILGIILIAVLATFLLCPGRLTRRKVQQPETPTVVEKGAHQPSNLPPTGAPRYESSTIASSQHHLLAPIPVRPVMTAQLTSSTPPTSSYTPSNQSVMTMPQPHQTQLQPQQFHQPQLFQQANLSRQNTLSESILFSPPMTSSNSTYSFGPDQVLTTATSALHTTPSVRSFMTRATTRQGHAHTPSDLSLLDANVAGARPQQQPLIEPTPYIINEASSSSSGSAPPGRKYNGGLLYTPPPPATPILEDIPAAPTGNQGFAPSVAGETYYGVLGSHVGIGNEIDRAATMSPAEASSVVDAAPPYIIQDEDHGRPDMARYGNTRHTPRLPNVDEYPEEKSRFTGADL
ncbi:hypothetical protein FRC16_008923 [Serendipita sp. 398]|nr:hypothetical protein FRC16_008923 [Serendipita sp. 398]